MKKYTSINQLVKETGDRFNVESGMDFNRELIPLLELLEKRNPCGQVYELYDEGLFVSYWLRLNLFNFMGRVSFKIKTQIIGLPVSLSEKGYWGEETFIESILKQKKGIQILLNGNVGFKSPGRTLSTFVFENNFNSFKEYLVALRSPYRRRVMKALGKREHLEIRALQKSQFNQEHYNLYLSVMQRTKNPLETLPMEFFTDYEAELVEFINMETKKVMGFVQVKEISGRLFFLFGGFRKEEEDSSDFYYNMLLKIVEIGIEKKVKSIEFGQTAEESKLKIGCKEVEKYLVVHHSNPILNGMIQRLLPLFSYKPYPIKHHVFKENHSASRLPGSSEGVER